MPRRTIPGDPLLAVATLRVSTDDQTLGLAAQRSAIEAWAQRAGVAIVAFFEDHGVSGAAPIGERPGLVAALSALREHRAGILVAAKRDRIARDVVVAALVDREARAAGAHVVSADGAGNGDSPADEFMRTVIDGAAAYERALIRARTKAALGAKSARGERVGTLPFGFRLAADGNRLEPEDGERRVAALARQLRGDGLSFRAITADLAARGLVSRGGRPFTLARVHAMASRGSND